MPEKFLDNIEKTRNTKEQIDFYKTLEEYIKSCDLEDLKKAQTFPLFATRQSVTHFVEKYEMFKLIKNIPGNIVECGVAAGFGFMTFYHLSSIFEPYHYVRKVLGFDTFEGFDGITDKDLTSKASHLKKGGLAFHSYELLNDLIKIHDRNRNLGNINKAELIKGDISKTFPKYLEDNPSLVIALLYMDLDLYKPTLDTLRHAVKRIPKGGIIAFDELNHSDYPGETLAVMETLGISNLKLRRLDISSMLSYAVV